MTTSSRRPAENPNIYNTININTKEEEEEEEEEGDERRGRMRELLEAYLREHAPSRLSDLNTLAEHPRFNNININNTNNDNNNNNNSNNTHEMEKVYARLNKIYARERATTARQRRRMTAFYRQYAPSEVKKIQPLLERGLSEEVVFNALYQKYGVPAEDQLYSSAAQEHRRREIAAFLQQNSAQKQQEEKQQEEKEENEKEEITALEAAMNLDGPLDVVLQQLGEKYRKSGEHTSPSISHILTEEQQQEELSQQEQKPKERNESDKKSALRRRLTAFYAIHCPNKLEEKVSYAMSLNVDENVLFASLHRRYNLDADGNPLPSVVSSARSRCRRGVDELSCASSSFSSAATTITTNNSTITTARGTTTAVLTPEKEQIRQRLVAFYEKHNPVNMEAKVQRALSLNVEEEELFCALYRQYHLDESGAPIVKNTETHALSVEDDNHNKITTRDATRTEEQTSVDRPTGEEEKERDAMTENDRVTIKDEITYENDKTALTDSVKTLSRYERLQEFFQEFDEESREILQQQQQQWMTLEMSDDELMEYLYKLKERGEIIPSVEPKAVLNYFPPPLFAFEEEPEQITSFEIISEVQITTEVQKPTTKTTSTMVLSASHSDVCGDSPLTLFSRHTRWFAGSGWKDVERDQVRRALLSDLSAFTGWSCAKDMEAVVVAQQQDQQDGMQVTFFIPCKDSISAERNEEMVKTAVFHSAQQLLLDQMLTPQPHSSGAEEASCVVVRCLFSRMRGSVLRHASDTQRALFARALEVDLLAHAAQSGASHLTLGSRMSVHGGKGFELRCEMYFPSDAQAGEYVMLLLSDNAVYCREARRTYALLGGDAHEVAVAVVTPIPTSMAVAADNNNNNNNNVAAVTGSGDDDVWSIANRESALEYRESQLLAREKELQSRLILLEQRERVLRRLVIRDAESIVDITTSNNSAEDRAMRLASEVRARLTGN